MVVASLLAVSGLLASAQAASAIGYVTELPIFSQLVCSLGFIDLSILNHS